MAPRSRRRTSEGFSLVELQPVLTSVTSSIADELTSQGVDIDTNSLLMGIQSLVNQLVMNNPGVMMASDDQKPPYNLAADLIAMAYSHYQSGNKREAVQNFLTACEFEDAATLTESLLMMNNQADLNKRLTAAEEDDTDESEDDSDDGEMSDEEIDDLISEGETDDQGEDDDGDDQENDDAPMGGTSSAKPVTAAAPEDRAKRILAIKMSSAGDEAARKRAQRILG